ncbi:hypothetical protein PT85_03525 [Pseudomonas flexibilis]|jgi:hypothetical protein|uniref:Uncharacterized protein n=2 Tax=Pseudomonas TaxID=286 RepID=A0A0B3BVJ9_9PSED|nr:hypothetical protein PT85_03525 [Pseudomonas flexibilis]SCY31601.1 hypothetical protein SAMN02927929_02257 [Pseudomonas flexibilis]
MNMRTRPPMASKRLDLPYICDICGNARSTGKHARCSKLRQKRKDATWAAIMAEQEAVRRLNKEARRG